jgi:hypothetical protein
MRHSDISAKVMDEIETNHIVMRPRWHFALMSLTGALGVITLSIVTVYLVNIISLTIRIQSIDRPMYGARQHLAELISGFPWWMIIVAVIAMGALVWILRQQGRLYRIRLGWLIAAVIAGSVLLGLLFSISPLNQLHIGPSQNMLHGQQMYRR